MRAPQTPAPMTRRAVAAHDAETRPGTELRTHLQALSRFWKSVVLFTILGVLAAALASYFSEPKYQTRTTFFVATATQAGANPLQADEFAQRRINSYVGVINSERLAQVVLNVTGLPMTTGQLSDAISASADPETVLLTVTVTDVSPERSLLISRAVAANLDKTIGELDNRGTQSNVEIRVISGPTLNPSPVSPRTKLNLAIGLLAGLALGIAQALIRQAMDPTFRSREQLAEVTKLPTLGWLNFDRAARTQPILSPTADRSPRAEAFRQLRTNLRFVDAASPIRSLAVTSAIEEEGKSTTAVNLAISFAQSGRRTLLIDADLRKPQLARYLDLEPAAGLTSVLIGEAALAEVVQDWGPSGLQVLTSGPLPPNPTELLGSGAMEKLLDEARARYDLVVIDTPPVLPVADATVTAAEVDGVLLLVRHGKTHIDKVMRAVTSLEAVDARILGTVLTMARESRSERVQAYADKTA
jgi:capsular exopolysaccharide synthesis family protein